MRKRFLAGLLPLLVACGCAAGSADPVPVVSDATVAAPAAPGVPGAGYFTLRGGAGGDALLGVTSTAARRIEMHESVTDDRGVSSMRPVAQVPLGDDVAFAPGGRHLMVHDLRGDLAAGALVPLTFRFRLAAPVTVQARLVAPGMQGSHAAH